jgi:hypothetical protein
MLLLLLFHILIKRARSAWEKIESEILKMLKLKLIGQLIIEKTLNFSNKEID